uniref:Inter-alpha-trypsin inhibitor heavy chain family member 6 n=1 Tax=Lates calcarifer TaxID=8187 RepID=A0A4W6DCF4_LATCA
MRNPGSDSDPPPSTHVERSAGCARVRYSPTLQQQNSVSSKGLDADFVIQYDVNLRDLIGDVQVYDGYFVHYFAPRGLPVVPKDVIFVIDVSGSMIGTKIKQTKQAMTTILGDLREGDHFNIITFSDKLWHCSELIIIFLILIFNTDCLHCSTFVSGTNINAALLSAAQLVNPPSSGSSNLLSSRRVPLVIFLTDGEATIGVTAGDTILSNAKKALGSASLFGLAFGDDADFLLLKRLALDNRGVARMVYEDADAALQLKGFYDEVASPLLSDIQLSYLDDQAFDITRSLFPNYFQGSELVVTGRVRPGVKDLKVSMSATDSKQHVKIENDVLISHAKGDESVDSLDCSGGLEGISSFVHRLWAYFTIKELLLAKLNATDPATQRLLADKATNLSLKYNFVTPVTSLVVVKPDADEAAPMLTFTTTPPLSSVRTDPSPLPGRQLTPQPTLSVVVDGDPHFVVQLPKLHQSLCFTVDGRANDVLRLSNISFWGYYQMYTCVSFLHKGPLWMQGSVTRQGVTVTVDNHQSCWIELAKDVRFLVLFHHYKHPSYLQMAHLGFYITDGRGLSASTQGLLGARRTNKEGLLARGILRWGSEHMPVTLQDKTLKDTVRKRHLGKCWVVPKAEIQRLLGHPYESYVVDHV